LGKPNNKFFLVETHFLGQGEVNILRICNSRDPQASLQNAMRIRHGLEEGDKFTVRPQLDQHRNINILKDQKGCRIKKEK